VTFDPSSISGAVIAQIKADAIARYPNESCGAITPSGYIAFANVSTTPEIAFDCWKEMAPLQADGSLLALVHSHPNGPEGPSSFDMQQAEAMAIPWGLLVSAKDSASAPFFWGDMFIPPALLNRQFRHGPSGSDGRGDCYALIRDWYRQVRHVVLVEGYRDDSWWTKTTNNPDLYNENFARAGFTRVDPGTPQVGDVVLFKIRAPVANHAGVYVGDGMMMHHMSNRYSRLEPIGSWMKMHTAWLRHASA
jgi:proteasome lid subunit RPN8/RPN11